MASSDWPRVPLGTVLTDLQPGFASGVHNELGEGIPHLRPMNVTAEGQINRSQVKYVPETVGRPDVRLSDGDVLFNNTNSPELVGKTALFRGSDHPAFSNHMTRLRPDAARLDPGFLAIRLHQAWREGWFAEHCNNHASQANISRTVLSEFEIDLPPLAVQRAITALAEKLTVTRGTHAAHLTAVRTKLNRYIDALFAKACAGGLTADWRLARGLIDDGGPAGWRESTFKQECERVTVGHVGRMVDQYRDEGVPFLRSLNVRMMRFDPTNLKYVSVEFHRQLAKSTLHPGDVVVVRSGFVGTACVIPDSVAEANCSDLLIARPGAALDPFFAAIFINSPLMRRHVADVSVGSAQAHFNTKSLQAASLPVPPLEEQREVVRRVGIALDRTSAVSQRLASVERRTDRGVTAILAKACRGEWAVAGSTA
jgi:type I restriction enzyme, S subunit